MTMKITQTAVSALLCIAALAGSSVFAQSPEGSAPSAIPLPKMNALTQGVLDNPDLTEESKGIRTLQDYIVHEMELWTYIFERHPIFKDYAPKGKIIGKYVLSTRGSEFLGEGNAVQYSSHQPGNRKMASQYRLPQTTIFDQPNKYVGPEKCGECHAIQYEKWQRSRHAKTLRFPGQHPEINNDYKKKLYNGEASALPDGITEDVVYALVGTPRTKYGYIDAWLLRGTYHVRDGLLRDRTGTIVAGQNQFSRGWSEWLTPEMAKKIKQLIPDFPTDAHAGEFGPTGSKQWGETSYGSTFEGNLLIQSTASYCEICHTMKFDFPNKQAFFDALGDAKTLQKHTISRGISCEECHGEGGHLVGATSNLQTNCDRCHQRLNWIEDDVDKPWAKGKLDKAFNLKTKSSCPSCGTENAQLLLSKHYQKGMRCTTCHDPHEVTGADWASYRTEPSMKKVCKDCHPVQAENLAMTDTHSEIACQDCHMPFTMSCENFQGIQRPDWAGFDAVRRSHLFKIMVDPELKMQNPAAGQSRAANSKGWRTSRDENGYGYVDLMWSCARTAPADPGVADNKGCHSPFISELDEGLIYKDQKQIYGEVMKWQTPVKEQQQKNVEAYDRINKLLEVSKLKPEDRTEIMLLADKAHDINLMIEKDGSMGVHAPSYLKGRVDTAKAYLDKAQGLIDAGGYTPVKAAN